MRDIFLHTPIDARSLEPAFFLCLFIARRIRREMRSNLERSRSNYSAERHVASRVIADPLAVTLAPRIAQRAEYKVHANRVNGATPPTLSLRSRESSRGERSADPRCAGTFARTGAPPLATPDEWEIPSGLDGSP